MFTRNQVLILLLPILLLSCTRSGGYNYNICDIQNNNLVGDSLENFIIKLENFNFNNKESSDTNSFYGVFQGLNLADVQYQYNVIAFNTKISSKRLIEISDENGSIQIAVKVYKKVECFEFNSSFDIFKAIDKNKTIVVGELIMYMEDTH